MAQRYDFVIDQGSEFSLQIELFTDDGEPDLEEYEARGKLKKHFTSSNSYTLDCSVSNGVLTVMMASGYSANCTPGRYVYDVELENASNAVFRVIEGVATISPNVTV